MVTRLIVLIIFAVWTNTNSLSCTPKTNIILYVHYTSIGKKKGYFWKNRGEKGVGVE